MAKSIANASMLRSNNSLPRRTRRLHRANQRSTPNARANRGHTDANESPARSSLLAYLAFRSIFSRMNATAGGLISLFSHKVHSFFAMTALAGRVVRGFDTGFSDSDEPPHLCGGRSALALLERVSTLITRFPGFPVQLGCSGALLAAFLNESRIRGRVQCSVQEIRV